MKKHWYLVIEYYCPACCGVKTYRVRKYTPRPKDPEKRMEIHEAWDYCGAF